MTSEYVLLNNCPICDSDNISEVMRGDKFEDGLVTYLCKSCNLAFTNPMPNESFLNKFYVHEYRKKYSGYKIPSHKYLNRLGRTERATYHAKYLCSKVDLSLVDMLIDIGAAEGSFLHACKIETPQGGCPWRIGVEPNPIFSDWAIQRNFYDQATSSIKRLKLFGTVCISMIHVLEHIRNPIDFLRSLTNGQEKVYLYIDVPDMRKYSSISEIHMAHLYHFTPFSLSECLNNADFEILTIEAHQPPNHPKSIRVIALYQSGKTDRNSKLQSYRFYPELEMIKLAFQRVEFSKPLYFSLKQRLKRLLKNFRRMC